MPSFDYKAKNRMGETIVGVVDAIDERSAAGAVREMGLLPMDVRPAKGARVPKAQTVEAGNAVERYLISPLWTGVNIKALAVFYRQMHTLLGSGMSLSEALGSIGRRQRGRLGVIVHEMQDNIMSGGLLSNTMRRYPKVFSRLQISLIRAGESGGLLEPMIDRIASYLEYELKIRALVAKATIHPTITFILAVMVFLFLPHAEILVNKGFGPFWSIVGPQLAMCFFAVLGLIVIAKLVFQFDFARTVWDSMKLYVPGAGGTARKIAMSRFSRAMAVLYAAGISITESVDIASDACANLYLGGRMKYAIPSLQSGQGITESLARTDAVSPMVLDMLAVGEKSGSQDAVLQKVSDYMDDEVDASMHKLSIALFVVMLLAAGVLVGYVVIEFWQKFYGQVSRVGQ